MKQLVVFLLFFSCAVSHAQNTVEYKIDTVIDIRDGQLYETITLGKKTWFRQNLRFNTISSYIPDMKRMKKDYTSGNYYSFTELDSICPPGWHVATIEEWREYILLITDSINISYDTLDAPNSSVIVNIDSSHVNILELNNPLRLHAYGWVEGNKLSNMRTLNLWIANNQTHDRKYHIHAGKGGYVWHTHGHNILDKPKNQRRFPVRCVCDVK